MKNPELYHRSVDILVKAYIDGYLNPMDCAACAVGNLVAGNCGYKYLRKNEWLDQAGKRVDPTWAMGSLPCSDQQTRSTGYSREELGRIENAFISAQYGIMPHDGVISDENTFVRLMAVLSVLDQIHEVTDESIQQSSKAKFVRHETA